MPERLHALHAMKIAELASDMSNTPMLAKNPSWGIRKDGTEFLAESSASKWGTQNELFMTITLRDVTKREQTINALHKSEEQFRSFVETASDAIITTDLQGIIINWNRGAEKIYGYSADEIINKSFVVLLPGHFTIVSQTKMRRLCVHKNGIVFQDTSLPGMRKDGASFMQRVLYQNGRLNEGIFLTAIIRDVTYCHLAEKLFFKVKSRFRTMTEAVHVSNIYLSGVRLVYANPAAQLISGYSFEELQKFNFWDLFILV